MNRFYALILIMLLYSAQCGVFNIKINSLYAADDSTAVKNYLLLKNYYIEWNRGLFGSRKFHERRLKSFLINLIGKRIETDDSFKIVYPDIKTEKRVECIFRECRWLKLHGYVDVKGIEKLIKKDPGIVKKLWRSRLLFSVSGKVRKFRLGRDSNGDTIELYLTKINVRYTGNLESLK